MPGTAPSFWAAAARSPGRRSPCVGRWLERDEHVPVFLRHRAAADEGDEGAMSGSSTTVLICSCALPHRRERDVLRCVGEAHERPVSCWGKSPFGTVDEEVDGQAERGDGDASIRLW